ncbi:MAG: thioredoxin [Clostridia bacterium]|nr:thioredoxin [Clostridia bacterium]
MKKSVLGLLVLGAGILLIVIGAGNGEATVVFDKAVDICLQCIGIG